MDEYYSVIQFLPEPLRTELKAMPPERAARRIRRGLALDRARISFPFPLNLGIWGLSLLPACLAMPIARMFGYDR